MHYNLPTDLDAALALVADYGGKIIAGGTDVFPSAQQGQMPRNLLDITAVRSLSGISLSDNIYRIGAATTWTQIVKADLPHAFDALKQAALEIGSIQIQNAGTIGGNICNASPAADGVPPLLALDASVELASKARGVRVLKLKEFILHARKTALADDEIVTAILVHAPSMQAKSSFEKLGSRRYLVISITMVAAVIVCDGDGYITEARIAVGSCSPVAKCLEQLGASIMGCKPQDIEILPEHLSGLSPIDDVRGSGEYRLDVVAEQCVRAIRKAAL